jgi:hypothetical protein
MLDLRLLSAGSAFTMTVWSYADQLDIAVLSDVHRHTGVDGHDEPRVRGNPPSGGLPR